MPCPPLAAARLRPLYGLPRGFQGHVRCRSCGLPLPKNDRRFRLMAERRDAERAAEIARQTGIDEGTIRKREAAEKRQSAEILHARNEFLTRAVGKLLARLVAGRRR